MNTNDKKRIVVIGGGFAGLNFIKHIDKKKFEVILVDKNNYHSFPPLFYQIASSGLEPGSICFPFRREFRKGRGRGASYVMGEVKNIDTSAKEVITEFERIGYDYLVIACGTTNNFFGNQTLVNDVFTVKSVSEAIRCRNEILYRLERASLTKDKELKRRLLSFVVIGGGATGVEVAGALGEMKRYIVPREYPGISQDDITIELLEGSDRLLGSMSEKSQKDALKYLGKLLVDVKLGHLLKEYSNDRITLDDGSTLTAGMVIWTAGITGVRIDLDSNLEPSRGGRWAVDGYNHIIGLDDNIYAIGDIALMCTDEYPKGHPQLAQVALQQGKNLAKNLNRGIFKTSFKYKDKGTMATVGRNLAVADIKHYHMSGFPAWAAWMMIHLLSILGMRNKISVLIDWIWAYFSYGTSLRLLLKMSRYPQKIDSF
ncbi:MAG: NAD(P)/FAD-dependent oxidoreductase [Paramuribaculum sp.]|nr:NAD(P)/FAD-dependent oxidoreductase [Paramuribaculum sp.]